MKELLEVKVTENLEPVVSGRELHKTLEVETRYNDWFKRMCEYDFKEGKDFYSFLSKTSKIGDRPAIDHQLTISMAKELCILQRSLKGKQFKQYFIQIEEAWNSPEKVMARALKIANNTINKLSSDNERLTEINTVQEQKIAEMKPKARYYDTVLNCKDLISATVIAKDYGWTAKELNMLLSKLKVQYKQGDIWLLYQKYAEKGYTSTRTYNYSDKDGNEHMKVHTYWTQKGRLFLYDLLKNKGYLPLIEREGKLNKKAAKRFRKRARRIG